MTPLEAAQKYIRAGLLVVPIPPRQKKPVLESWQTLRLGEADLPKHFNGHPSNIGIILGDEYGTADVDLDAPETVAAAEELLPRTGFVFGRPSKPRSHRFYRCDPPVRTRQYKDPVDGACLVELRCRSAKGETGLQTVVPPSTHPTGEPVQFEPGASMIPQNIDADVLERCVAGVAAAALLARHWPGEGSRNQAFIALAGVFARAGWPLRRAQAFHRALYRCLWGRQADIGQAEREVQATFEKHAAGLETTGRRTLAELVDERALRAALRWLGIDEAPEERAAPQTGAKARPMPKVQSFSLEDVLNDETIKQPEMLIADFLPRRGLMLFGGRPKEGKSWFACQLALAVATGRPLGGFLEVLHPGRVHLWALEDGLSMTKDKMLKVLNGARPEGLADLRVFAELPLPILGGGDELIRAQLREHPAELVILDSLFKLAGARNPKADISQTDYDIIDRCRRIGMDHGCAVVVIMHTKKGAAGSNPIENLLGTTGNTAAADVVCELKRKGRQGTLAVVGRFAERKDYELAWFDAREGAGWGWAIQGAEEDAALGEASEEVLAYLQAEGSAQPATIARALRRSFRSVWNALDRLRARGKVVREGRKWTATE
jgi:hypothetical protein